MHAYNLGTARFVSRSVQGRIEGDVEVVAGRASRIQGASAAMPRRRPLVWAACKLDGAFGSYRCIGPRIWLEEELLQLQRAREAGA